MNRTELVAVEKRLRAAESNLVAKREAMAQVDAQHDATRGYLVRKGIKLDSPEAREQFARIDGMNEGALKAYQEALEDRDRLIQEHAKLSPPLGSGAYDAPWAASAGHGHSVDDDGRGRGLGIAFGPQDVRRAMAQLDANVPVRLGPPRISDPNLPSGFGMVVDSSGWPTAEVPIYNLDVWPALREKPLVQRIFPSRSVDNYAYVYYRVTTLADQAAPVAEGGTKPASDPRTTQFSCIPQVIAHVGSFTRQAMYNAANFLDVLSGEYVAGLYLAIDKHLLTGTGDAPDLDGIIGTAGVGSVVRDDTNETRLAAIFRALTNVRVNGFTDPTHIIIHPEDLRLTRTETADTSGLFLAAPMEPVDASGLPHSIWGLQTVVTTAIEQGTAIIIDPNKYGELIVRQVATLEINPFEGWDTNELGLRCEAWLNLAAVYPQAACVLERL